MIKTQFIKTSRVRKFCNANGRLLSPEFVVLLETFVRRKLTAACNVHNGSKKTLDATVAAHVGISE